MRGSVALEFLLVLLAVTVYAGVVMSAAQSVSRNVAEDLSKMVRTRIAMDKIYNAVQFLYSGADGSSTTVVFYVPSGVTITLTGNSIEANVPTEGNFSSAANCDGNYCQFKITMLPLRFSEDVELSGGLYYQKIFQRVGNQVKVS